MKYESNNITASSSRQYHAGILIFQSKKKGRYSGSDGHVYLINVTADQPVSENSTRGGVGDGFIAMKFSNTY